MAAAETWIRIVIYKADRPDDEKVVEYMKKSVQEVVRMLEKQPGYQLGYWGNNKSDGTMAAVTYWSSKSAIERAAESLAGLHAEREGYGIKVDEVHNVRLFSPIPAGAHS